MARDQRRLAAMSPPMSRVIPASRVGTTALLWPLKAHRQELIDPKIAEYGSRIVKTTSSPLGRSQPPLGRRQSLSG